MTNVEKLTQLGIIGDVRQRLGSENETDLYFENKLPTKVGETQYIGRYHDLHFCSKEHFIKYFFDREPE